MSIEAIKYRYSKEGQKEEKRKRNAVAVRKWSEKNKEYKKEQVRIWRLRNLDYRKEYSRLYRLSNQEYFKDWYLNHPNYNKEYYETNFETIKEQKFHYAHNKRVEESNKQPFNEIGYSTIIEIFDWKFSNPSLCIYCKENEAETLDHFIPIAKGGQHKEQNLVPSCQVCNSIKNDKLFLSLEKAVTYIQKRK
jgi:5-methylcytosine-specific restriction endonuclease McrA